MINFDDVPLDEEYSNREKLKLDIGVVLQNIDTANFSFYNELSEEERKLFTPYTVQRWVGSLDDAIQVTYNAKSLESIFGKWKEGGKAALNEFIEEFNGSSMKCSSVVKYEHAKFDWRFRFSMESNSAALEFIASMKEFAPNARSEIISLTSTEVVKNNVQMLNELVNVHFWELHKYPELVYKLLCLVSVLSDTNKKDRSWLPFSKNNKKPDAEISKVLRTSLSALTSLQLENSEYKILVRETEVDKFDLMLTEHGYQESERKALLKKFKSEKEKYGK